MTWTFLLILLLTKISFAPSEQFRPVVSDEMLLWVAGQTGEVHTYRIPLIIFTSRGSLLAFAEARKLSSKDIGAKFIALRRSTDKGATWSSTSFIVDDGFLADGLNLGSVVVDEETGAVLLLYALCFHHYRCNPSSTMMVESLDDGITWTHPRNLSIELGVKSFSPGPGFGIQKKRTPAAGRLVVCGHGTVEGDGVFCILSDDHGRSWRYGAELKSIPYNQPKQPFDFDPDECQPVELDNGDILINVRNNMNYHCHCRMFTRSRDGGETLPVEELLFDPALVDPAVAAGSLMKDGTLFFTNPDNSTSRVNLTMRWSYDDGSSWVKDILEIWPGPSGYSSMTSYTPDHKHIYVIYEKGHQVSIESISFVKINLLGDQ